MLSKWLIVFHVQLGNRPRRIVIITRRDVKMRGKCSLRPVKYFYFCDNSLTSIAFFTIEEELRIGFHVLTWKIVKHFHSAMFLS